MIELKLDERIDDLEFKGLKIIQNKNGFCFGIDAVLLSDFAKNIKNEANVLDLGTGTGIVSILLCGKTRLKHITGIEVQEDVYDMAKRSSILNHLENRFEVIHSNILDLESNYCENTFDAIVTNPPYKKMGTGIQNEKDQKTISRHEIMADLEDFIRISRKFLKDKGEFYMVHRPERLVDIMSLMRSYKIEPKELRLVYAKKQDIPKLVLIKGIKNAKSFLKIHPNLYIYEESGEYTEEIYRIYQKEGKKNE